MLFIMKIIGLLVHEDQDVKKCHELCESTDEDDSDSDDSDSELQEVKIEK